MNIEPLSSLDEILPLLTGCNLSVTDISASSPPHFFGVRVAGALVGVVGLEIFQFVGLLRSLAVSSAFRGHGYARDLVRFVEGFAATHGVESVFLLTTTAEVFFSKLGYSPASRRNAPKAIQATPQFSALCPSSSAFMSKHLAEGKVFSKAHCMTTEITDECSRFYSTSDLALLDDPSGAKFWSVHLRSTMLTYFEVPPNTVFAMHQHESEQITNVLEGELFFQIGDVITRVGSGEVIAIPSQLQHSVFTKATGCRAVDAWSPLPPQYVAAAG